MKYLYTYLLLLLSFHAIGQQNVIILSTPETGNRVHIAREQVVFLPGYHFVATQNSSMLAAIDRHPITPATYQTEPPSPERDLSTSYAIGTTVGVADVTPTGAATYQIPIDIPPGIGGVQPNLSVAYNSQSGNGLLGLGWNLAGISAISRCGKTIYHDGEIDAIRLNNMDNLMLDGQRLILIAGVNLTFGAEYRTEIETFNDIRCKTIGSRLYFEVITKDGWILEYGITPDSYIEELAPGTTPLHWLLAKATDPSGNYMTYTYIKKPDNSEFFLKQIDYTGNIDLQPYNRIKFFYESRYDSLISYVAGGKLKQSVLLTGIKAFSTNTTFREYKFNYYYDGFHSKLTEIEEFGENNERYNSTIVDWGDYDGDYAKYEDEYFSWIFPNKDNSLPIYADFNGDGKTDFISYQIKSSLSYSSSDVATVYLAYNYYGDVQFVAQATIPLVSGFQKLMLADLNGDGLMDVVRIRSVNPILNNNFRYDFFIYNGTSFTQSGGFNSFSADAVVGDFTGTGRQEILTRAESRVYNQSGSIIANGGITWGTSYFGILPDRTLIDVNGNGKTNLLVVDASGFRVYELNGTAFSLLCLGADLKNSDGHIIGDFNGDGKMDILVQRLPNEYYILFSNGTGFEKKQLPNLNITGKGFAVDFNRDGKTDIVHVAQNDGYGFPLRVGLFDGENFQFENYGSYFITPNNMNTLLSWEYLHFADFDGDGYPELSFARYIDAFIMKSFNSQQNLLVKNIVDGLNNTVSFDYNPITNTSYYTSSSSTYSFPVVKFQQPLYVTTAISRNYGNLNDYEHYHYTGARLHKQGKGFLGFESIRKTNSAQNRRIVTNYGYNTTYYNIYPTQQTVTNANGTTDISTVSFSNNNLVLGTKRIFPYVSNEIATDHLIGLSVTTNYQYLISDDGNPWRITKTRGNLITQITNTWVAKGSNFKNRLAQSIVNRSGLDGVFSDTTVFDYDNNGRLISQIDFKGNPKAVTTTYGSFDRFGNPQDITTEATNCSTINLTLGYDSRGRPISRTNAIGTTETEYDIFSRVTSVTDMGGLTTSFEYDGFGNLIEENSPVGITTHTLAWDISHPHLYRADRTQEGVPSQSVWYNAPGQIVRTRIQGFSGDVFTRNEYNHKGQLYRSYLPGYGTPSTKYTEYQYNALNRLEQEISVAGTTTYDYNGLNHTVTYPDGTFRTTTLNSAGLTASVTDEGGTINYAYNSLGKPIAITAVGLTTYIGYDYRGFQNALQEPNLGETILYDYDAYGMLRSQTNARGQATTFTYDAVGRMISEVSPDINLTYHYATSGGGKGQLESIRTGRIEHRKIVYTHLGLPEQVIERIDNTNYITQYTYDAYGRLQQKVSPSGFELWHQYDNNGYLIALRNGTNNNAPLLWQPNEINALGQITHSTFGNGLTRHTAYNTANLTLQSITLNDGANPIDQIAYNFIPTSGNLQQRNDITNARNETFGYDAQNRLNSISVNFPVFQNISYEPNGNILTKFDVGTYLYGNNNHAVTSISPLARGYTPPAYSLTHTSFERPSQITQGSQQLTFSYGPDKQRNKSVHSPSLIPRTRYYVGSYEKDVNMKTIKEYDYIHSPEGLIAIAIKTNNGAREVYAVHTDHLGSLRMLTDANKDIVSQYRYDAWGKRTLVTGTNITNRGFTGHEHLEEFGLINMNARLYDPVLARFLSPDPYVPDATYTQDFNRYTYARNNPLSYIDPTGEIVWFVPVIIGAVVGSYVGGALQSGTWNPFTNDYWQNGWQGAIAGGLVGAAAGGLFSAAIGASGMTVAGTNVATKAWGITSTALNSSAINIGMNALSGGGWDGAWKAGLVGLGTGLWGATGGLGMVNAWGAEKAGWQLAGKLGHQMIGTAGGSIGNNWANGVDPFSKVTVGVGPVNLTFGRGQQLLQWQNNIGNIAANTLGLGNMLFGGNTRFEWRDLAFVYSGGLIDRLNMGAMGAYAVMGESSFLREYGIMPHEMHHVWQSRALGDRFLPNYFMQGISAVLSTKRSGQFIEQMNFFERQAWGRFWW
ncbi:MAG: FG-GAP-like repeat-containing protein [Bacteroidales bacterium]|nr:FG-GAP-like repeat-containing protein [Bacteroidales bacterium]